MSRRSILFANILLTAVLISCVSGLPSPTPQANTPITVMAITAEPSSTQTQAPSLLLPRSLYYQGFSESSNNYQIFRLERDGITKKQITNDPEGIQYFDILPVDGKIAYVNGEKRLILKWTP